MTQHKAQYDDAIQRITAAGAPFEIVDQVINGVTYKCYKNAPRNLPDLFAPGRDFADKEFLVYEGERCTFKQFFQQADSIGHQLVNAYGVKKGDRVALAMRNYPEWMTAFVAITSIGAVAVPLNSWGQARELEYGLTDAGATVLFCDQQRLDYIAPRLSELGIRAVVVRSTAAAQPENVQTLEGFIATAANVNMPGVAIDPEDIALIMYTSGTTGNPKGAVSCHRGVCQAIYNFECTAIASAMTNPEAIGKMLEKGYEPAGILAVPLFHISGCHAQFLLALRGGRKLVMMYKWDAAKALAYVESERVTMVAAAPSMLMDLLEAPEFDSTDTKSLFALGAGGAATPPRVAKLATEKVPDGFPGTGWGMTETNGLGSSFTGSAFEYKPGSAGFLHPIAEVEIRDDDGKVLAQGEPGNIWIKGPAIINEYWHKPEANAKEFNDGWFLSGDIGYFDEEGFLFLSDRAKDMVIRGGENIFPVEIESTLLDHPAVHEVAAFGVPHEKLGEELAVVVVTKAEFTLTEEEITAFASERLARFKVPTQVALWSEPLPRNATNKVLKKHVKEAFLQR